MKHEVPIWEKANLTIEEAKFTLFILGQLPKLVHTDAKVGSGFFNG